MGDIDDSSGWARSGIRLPQSFLDMPRWWREGTEWLEDLPRAIQFQCEQWDLRVEGELSHGSNAVVVPVARESEAFVLRMTPPGTGVAEQVSALRFWDGRGTVQLIDADVDRRAILLERLDMHRSLADRPVDEAVAVLGQMMRRLAVAVPASLDVRSTAAVVRARAAKLEPEWRQLQRPFDSAFLTEALDIAVNLSSTRSSALAVNGDLHSGQVLRGSREPWLTVDPILLRGDIEYDLARVLWTRLDDMADAAEIVEHFETAVAEGGLDRAHARDWVVF
ncbi:aminoglycoside phosphotransferase family protein [Streptomyces sp. NPDC051320]|uniref:aminoglycoside phosphotransferase family protein n=1 Tax=Streptomyces sp. NPDC051320 TaxID=3154644 RepID=UPI00342248A6